MSLSTCCRSAGARLVKQVIDCVASASVSACASVPSKKASAEQLHRAPGSVLTGALLLACRYSSGVSWRVSDISAKLSLALSGKLLKVQPIVPAVCVEFVMLNLG